MEAKQGEKNNDERGLDRANLGATTCSYKFIITCLSPQDFYVEGDTSTFKRINIYYLCIVTYLHARRFIIIIIIIIIISYMWVLMKKRV
jgi:hypothetical protein